MFDSEISKIRYFLTGIKQSMDKWSGRD